MTARLLVPRVRGRCWGRAERGEAQRQSKDVIFHSGAMFVRQDYRGGAMVAKMSEANLLKKPHSVFVGLVVRIIHFVRVHRH